MDVEKVRVRVWRAGIHQKILHWKIPTWCVTIVHFCLSNHSFQVNWGAELPYMSLTKWKHLWPNFKLSKLEEDQPAHPEDWSDTEKVSPSLHQVQWCQGLLYTYTNLPKHHGRQEDQASWEEDRRDGVNFILWSKKTHQKQNLKKKPCAKKILRRKLLETPYHFKTEDISTNPSCTDVWGLIQKKRHDIAPEDEDQKIRRLRYLTF